jgi:hypothetical protein
MREETYVVISIIVDIKISILTTKIRWILSKSPSDKYDSITGYMYRNPRFDRWDAIDAFWQLRDLRGTVITANINIYMLTVEFLCIVLAVMMETLFSSSVRHHSAIDVHQCSSPLSYLSPFITAYVSQSSSGSITLQGSLENIFLMHILHFGLPQTFFVSDLSNEPYISRSSDHVSPSQRSQLPL